MVLKFVMGIDWRSMRFNIAKWQREFINKEERYEVLLMTNGRMGKIQKTMKFSVFLSDG